MQNNEPYLFEKPLRAKSKQRARLSKVTAFSALGISLLGVGAGNLIAVQAKPQDVNSLEASSLGQVSSSSATNPELATNQPGTFVETAQIGSVATADSTIALPIVANSNFGNTSSATPYAGEVDYDDDDDDDDDDDEDDDRDDGKN